MIIQHRHRPEQVGPGNDAQNQTQNEQRRGRRGRARGVRIRWRAVPVADHQRHVICGRNDTRPGCVRTGRDGTGARAQEVRARTDVPGSPGRRVAHGPRVQGPRADVRRPLRQIRPVLRARTGQRPAADAHGIQDPVAVVGQDIRVVSIIFSSTFIFFPSDENRAYHLAGKESIYYTCYGFIFYQ